MTGKRRADGPDSTKATRPSSRKSTTKKTAPRRTTGQKVRRVLKWLFLLGLGVFLIGVGGLVYAYQTTDLPDPNAEFETETTFVYYSDGETEAGQFATQNRDSIALAEMPDDIKDAVIAIENQSFYTDRGIDPRGILRAAFSNASGNSTQGASTITQQYVKILYLTQERSYTRKLKEAILSLKVQQQVSKDEILEGYLNTIYFGRGAYGIQAAAGAFFDKPAAELTLRESAVLASVINNPTLFDPANGKDARERLKGRYAQVLANMEELGDITAEEGDEAVRRLPKFPEIAEDSAYGGQKGHMLELVKDELLTLRDADGNAFTEEMIDGGGLRITTTFTERAMQAAEQGVLEARPEMPPRQAAQLHVGAALVQPGTGAVRGIYGGQDYLESQINWAVAGGQAGSILKPFALTAGIKDGFSLRDTFEGNSPIVINDTIEFRNQGDSDRGSAVNLITATADSINTAFIDLTDSMDNGPAKVVAEMNAMGIPPSPDNAKRNTPGIPNSTPGLEPNVGVALGSATVSPINMANAYATLANGGVAAEPFVIDSVLAEDGRVLYEHSVQDRQAIDDELGADIAADVTYAMQQVVEQGSGSAAQALDRPSAGKTGTSTNDNDDVVSSWYAGFTPQMSSAVVYVRGKGAEPIDGWLPDDDSPGDGYFGGTYPAQTWTAIMQRVMEGVEVEEFPEPVYVDGEAPSEGHSPTTAPPRPTRPPRPTQEPSQSEEPTQEPTQEPSTQAPPPPPPTTQAPPPPAETACAVFDCSTPTPTPAPTPTPQPTPPPSNPAPAPPAPRVSALPPIEASRWWTSPW